MRTSGQMNQRPKQLLKPPCNMSKINVDAAVAERRGMKTIAAIARDENGSFLAASTLGFTAITNPDTLEALVVREALALSEDLHLQSIHVASDCKEVIDSIKEKNRAEYGAILHEIIAYSSSFYSCNFVHEFRSSNVEAHNLAKHALKLGVGRRVWLGHPGDLPFVPVNIVTV